MSIIAQTRPDAKMITIRYPSNCQYPWCSTREFDEGESAFSARIPVIGVMGNMHVRHTDRAHLFDGERTEYADDSQLSSMLSSDVNFPQPVTPTPLSSIPEAYRTVEGNVQIEERLIAAADLPNLAKEVRNRGAFTTLPFAHGKSTQCKIIIYWDEAR